MPVKSFAPFTEALASSRGTPTAASTAALMVPKPIPSAPSKICATKPTAANAHVSGLERIASRDCHIRSGEHDVRYGTQ